MFAFVRSASNPITFPRYIIGLVEVDLASMNATTSPASGKKVYSDELFSVNPNTCLDSLEIISAPFFSLNSDSMVS